jgi:hypothetical protein
VKESAVRTKHGEAFTIYQADKGLWCCPVCGSPELEEPPYLEDGAPSFDICSCGFEFGYDDSPLATSAAVKGVVKNWERWRKKMTDSYPKGSGEYAELKKNLENIGVMI